MKHYVEH